MQQFRSRTLIAAIAVLSAIGCGQQGVGNAHAEISAMPPTLDFGIVRDAKPLSLSTTLTNWGSETLTIASAVVTQDSSGAFSVSGVPDHLAPGGTAVVNVVMTPPPESGLYGASLTITSNASDAPKLLIELSAQVEYGAPPDAGAQDAGSRDAGTQDAGPVDAGADAGSEDAGSDAGSEDAGFDAGPEDAGVDAGSEDAGNNGCAPGQIVCNGTTCVNAQTDNYNCGTCGTRCDPRMGCAAGTCIPCDPTATYETLVTDAGQVQGLATNTADTDLYWVDYVQGALERVGISGGTPVTLVTNAQVNSLEGFDPISIGLDSSHVYVANQTGQSVLQTGLNGGTIVTLSNGLEGAWPGHLAIDSTHVYWAIQTTGDIEKAPIGGGTVVTLATALPDALNGSQYDVIGVDSQNVYITVQVTPGQGNSAILEVGLNGGTPVTLIGGLDYPTSGAVDATNVYWTDGYDDLHGKVLKIATSVSGATPVTLATGQSFPRRLVIDSENVYWSAGNTASDLMSCNGTVQLVPINGGASSTLVYGQYSAWALAVDATSLYWSDLYGGTIMKIAK